MLGNSTQNKYRRITLHLTLNILGTYFNINTLATDGIDKLLKPLFGCLLFLTIIAGSATSLLVYSGFHVFGLVNNLLLMILDKMYLLGLIVISLGASAIFLIDAIVFYQTCLVPVGLQCMHNFLTVCSRLV